MEPAVALSGSEPPRTEAETAGSPRSYLLGRTQCLYELLVARAEIRKLIRAPREVSPAFTYGE